MIRRGGWYCSRPYKSICRGGWCSQTSPINRFVGAADNTSRSYKSTICSHSFIGAAGKTAPTNGYQPPLKKVFYVVIEHKN